MEEQVEESKEPEKVETKDVEEEEPARTEDDREVQIHFFFKPFIYNKIFSVIKVNFKFHLMDTFVCQEEEKKRQEELERQRRERRYILPDEPTILVHPNWAAKNGKFDCSVMSLSVLLDYRLEDNKEHSFEVRINALGFVTKTCKHTHVMCVCVCFLYRFFLIFCLLSVQVSLFAELFNEMLQRDFGYRIYKALAALPTKDEKKEKKAKKEAEKKEAEKREMKKEKEEENEEPTAKKTKEDEEEKKKVSAAFQVFTVCLINVSFYVIVIFLN